MMSSMNLPPACMLLMFAGYSVMPSRLAVSLLVQVDGCRKQ